MNLIGRTLANAAATALIAVLFFDTAQAASQPNQPFSLDDLQEVIQAITCS
jgi:hypothetical protein